MENENAREDELKAAWEFANKAGNLVAKREDSFMPKVDVLRRYSDNFGTAKDREREAMSLCRLLESNIDDSTSLPYDVKVLKKMENSLKECLNYVKESITTIENKNKKPESSNAYGLGGEYRI